MRKFLIFNISDEMTILAKNKPYTLYKSMEQIYNLKKKDYSLGFNIYEQLINPIDKDKVNSDIFNNYKDNDYYSKISNKHIFNNKYKPENSTLLLNNTYIILESNVNTPVFLKFLKNYKNYFACDFENKDYFWLNELNIVKSK